MTRTHCIMFVLVSLAGTSAALADPPPPPPPPPRPELFPAILPQMFCFRVSDIERVPSSTNGFILSFEVLNWTNVSAEGLVVAQNQLSTGLQGAAPRFSSSTIPGLTGGQSFGGASIDPDGRGGPRGQPAGGNDIGPGTFDVPAMHSGRGRGDIPGLLNDWSAAPVPVGPARIRNTAAYWTRGAIGTPIPARDVLGAASPGDSVANNYAGTRAAAQLVPGTRLITDPSDPSLPGRVRPVAGFDALGDLACDGGPGITPNPISPDGTGNVLDGFTVQVEDWDPGEILSLNWALLGPGNQAIGRPLSGPLPRNFTGNAMGFGVFQIMRLANPLTTGFGANSQPGWTFVNGQIVPGGPGMTGLQQTPLQFFDNVFDLPNPAQFGLEFGSGVTFPFVDPSDADLFGEFGPDNFSRDLPSPGAAALLGLAGATLLRRRRST
jgi:MYXO-CTERM domain-containing protein